MPAANVAIPVLSNYLVNKLLDLTIRQVAFATPTPYLGLYSVLPAAGAGTGGTELTSGTAPNYARIAIPSGTTAFSAAAAGSIVNANAALSFAAATGAWPTVVGWGVFDAVTAGNLLYSGPLTSTVAAPGTAPTMTATGGGTTGGSLAAGAYLCKYTWSTANGETTASPELAAAVTVAAGNIPQVTIPALPTGAINANLYLTPAGGASGTEVFYSGLITGTTYNLVQAAVAGERVPPTVNTAIYTYTKTPGNGDTLSFAVNTFTLSAF